MITKQQIVEKIAAWLRHEITQEQLVAWAEEAIREGDFPEADAPELAQVVGRLGLADVKDFGLGREKSCVPFFRPTRARLTVCSQVVY